MSEAEKLERLLESLDACKEACDWSRGMTLAQAWKQCERADWMLWLCGRMVGKPGWSTHQQVVLAACSCAECCLPIFEARHLGDKRPRTAIETARAWARGKATTEQVRHAADAAYAATAYAAAATAYAAAAAAYAAYTAYAAAANAYAGGSSDELRAMTSICRETLAIPAVLEDGL